MEYFSKNEKIIDLVRDKTVLHLGSVGCTDLETSKRVRFAKQSLHYSISQISRATGIDYSRDEIEFYKTNKIFENIIFGNVERLDELDLNQKFDVIVAGDIIEHLSNPGLLLDGLKRFCHQNTIIIVTTPHSFGAFRSLLYAFGKFTEGKEHVMTFNACNIINILERHGFITVSIDTCYQEYAKRRYYIFWFVKKLFELFPKFGGTLFIIAKYPIYTNQ